MTSTDDKQAQLGKTNLRPAYILALCSLMVALGIVIMLSSSIIPIMTYTSPYLADLVIVPVVVEFGRKHGWMTWFATAVLSLLLCTDKEAAFFYIFFGYYPIIKTHFDQIRPKVLQLFVKFLFAACVLFVMYGLLIFVLKMDLGFPGKEILYILVFVLLIVVFFGLDRGVRAMEGLYQNKLRQKLRFLR